jgi:hypothetical protein
MKSRTKWRKTFLPKQLQVVLEFLNKHSLENPGIQKILIILVGQFLIIFGHIANTLFFHTKADKHRNSVRRKKKKEEK